MEEPLEKFQKESFFFICELGIPEGTLGGISRGIFGQIPRRFSEGISGGIDVGIPEGILEKFAGRIPDKISRENPNGILRGIP